MLGQTLCKLFNELALNKEAKEKKEYIIVYILAGEDFFDNEEFSVFCFELTGFLHEKKVRINNAKILIVFIIFFCFYCPRKSYCNRTVIIIFNIVIKKD